MIDCLEVISDYVKYNQFIDDLINTRIVKQIEENTQEVWYNV
jgi:ribosomal protein S3AE